MSLLVSAEPRTSALPEVQTLNGDARELANTPEFAKAQRQRKKVEAQFAELKKSDRAASLALPTIIGSDLAYISL